MRRYPEAAGGSDPAMVQQEAREPAGGFEGADGGGGVGGVGGGESREAGESNGQHENQAGIMPGSQGEKETEVQDEATTRGAELLLSAARVRDVYGSMSQSSPAFNTTVPIRPHARDTPRAESDLLKPPPVGTKWHWQPAMCNADGANAGPKRINNICLVTDPLYTHVRGHCSVHVKRDIQQQRHAVFEGSSEEVKDVLRKRHTPKFKVLASHYIKDF
jgi:hypothetical protein